MLSPEEVTRLLQAAPGLKYKAALSVAYGAGLRVSEVANLKVSDIDSQRMTLRVEQGKGQRARRDFAEACEDITVLVRRAAGRESDRLCDIGCGATVMRCRSTAAPSCPRSCAAATG